MLAMLLPNGVNGGLGAKLKSEEKRIFGIWEAAVRFQIGRVIVTKVGV